MKFCYAICCSKNLIAATRAEGGAFLALHSLILPSRAIFVLLIPWSPKIAQKWFFIQNLHMDLSFQEKTSPPSARVAAMRFLLQQIAKQNFIERNTLKTFYEIFLKHT